MTFDDCTEDQEMMKHILLAGLLILVVSGCRTAPVDISSVKSYRQLNGMLGERVVFKGTGRARWKEVFVTNGHISLFPPILGDGKLGPTTVEGYLSKQTIAHYPVYVRKPTDEEYESQPGHVRLKWILMRRASAGRGSGVYYVVSAEKPTKVDTKLLWPSTRIAGEANPPGTIYTFKDFMAGYREPLELPDGIVQEKDQHKIEQGGKP